MRLAGHQRTATPGTVLSAPALSAPVPGGSSSAFHVREHSPVATVEPAETQVLLSPAGTFVGGITVAADHRTERQRQLATVIRQRIESRLAGRVRDLSVRIAGNRVVLEGKCSTYYTKQLAQHAALAILEDEQLDNAIVVAVPR